MNAAPVEPSGDPLHPRPILIYCKILLMNDNLNVQMIEFVLFALHERQSKMFLASNLEYCIIFPHLSGEGC